MTLDELPHDVKELSGRSQIIVKGRKAKKSLEQQLKDEIWPWPQTTGVPGGPPKYTVTRTASGKKFNQFKDLILFILEPNLQSVVIGPIIFDPKDTPGLLEFGGVATRPMPHWYRRKDGAIRVNYEDETKRFEPHPYMGPAFDRTRDALIPRIFREIF